MACLLNGITAPGHQPRLADAVDEARGGHLADAGDARVAVRRVAHQSEEIGNAQRFDAEFLAHGGFVAHLVSLAIHLHYSVAAHALSEILVRCPDADFLDALVRASE